MAPPTTRSATKAQKHQQLLRNKRPIVVRNYNLRPKRQRSVPIGPPPTHGMVNHVNSMPPEMMGKVFDELDLREQFKLRAVCHLWKCVVEGLLAARTRYVRLNLRKPGPDTDFSKWNPVPSYRAMQFEGVWDEPTNLRPDQKVSLTLHSVNHQMAISFGRIFSQVHTLVIYFDLKASKIEYLIRLLVRSSKKVESLSLIMSTKIRNAQIFPLICEHINVHFGALKRLDLFVSDYEREMLYGFHPAVQLASKVSLLTHLGLCGTPLNFIPIMTNTGAGQAALREMSLSNTHQLNSLSIQCRMDGPDIVRMFESNPELARVNRLQLTCVNGPPSRSRPMVDNFLAKFNQVQNLQLYYCTPSFAVFNKRWITILVKMPKLTELTLGEFALGHSIPKKPKYRLPNVKKFTLATSDLLSQYTDKTLRLLFTLKFINAIVYMFPSLEELVIRAGEKQSKYKVPLELMAEKMRKKLFTKLEPKLKRVHIDFQDPTCLHIRYRNYTAPGVVNVNW